MGAKIRLTAEQWQRRGAPVDLLDAAAVAAATGNSRYVAALRDRRGGDLNPLSFARGLALAAQRAGAAVFKDSSAVDLKRAGGGWMVSTATGSVSAAHIVLATNGYTDDLWPGLRRTVVPVFGAIAATVPLGAQQLHRVMPSRSVLYESGSVTVYYRVDGGGRLLIGGRGPMREIDSIGAIPHLISYASRLWPCLSGVSWAHAWGGRLAMTRDHYPHIHEPAPGVLVGLGYNGRGVAMSVAVGSQLARRILTPSMPLDMPITSMKTIALHSLWPAAVQAVIARGRIADRLGL